MGVLKRRLVSLSARALVEVGRHVSPRVAVWVGGTVGRRFKLDPRLNKRQLRQNLRRFFPERDAAWVDATARAVQANSVRARLFDKHFLPEMATDELDRVVEMVNWEYPERARAAGRGAIVASLHYGRFWATPVWFSRHGYLASAFQVAKGGLPDEGATLSGGSLAASDPAAALRAVRALKSGSFLFLLLDAGRVPRPVTVDFLDHPTLVSPAVVRLARAADALIIPGLVPIDPNDPERVFSTFYEPIDPRQIPADEPLDVTMRRIFEPLEKQVRSDPSQWYGASNAHRRLAPHA